MQHKLHLYERNDDKQRYTARCVKIQFNCILEVDHMTKSI